MPDQEKKKRGMPLAVAGTSSTRRASPTPSHRARFLPELAARAAQKN
jgi:hypothetical protein